VGSDIVISPSSSIRGGEYWARENDVSAFIISMDELLGDKDPKVRKNRWKGSC